MIAGRAHPPDFRVFIATCVPQANKVREGFPRHCGVRALCTECTKKYRYQNVVKGNEHIHEGTTYVCNGVGQVVVRKGRVRVVTIHSMLPVALG